jgi:hypothetical protein
MPCWAEIDLGSEYQINEVALGNEHFQAYTDRAATELRILKATEPNHWHPVAEHNGAALTESRLFTFAPVTARWVRVEITAGERGMPRLDEIEVYEAEPTPGEFAARRGPRPDPPRAEGQLCQGSKQYRDEAERRLLAHCADGVAFLMFDGTWWNGGCDNPGHGHPVPYRWEDHIRAHVDLAQRIHAKYPDVLIEMHDMLAGGTRPRPTPVYYKYGLPGSYDENWGFELMWHPLDDLREGRAAALYYYNLGCNIPVYLHIDLRNDNRECLVLWWYASTCRHLGIGGTHTDPEVVNAHQAAMRWYAAHDEFFKRGEFYGPNEQVHFHVLPERDAFVVNLFNLSDDGHTVTGSVSLKDLGLDPTATYTGSEAWGSNTDGEFHVMLEMPPWSARAAEFRATAAR